MLPLIGIRPVTRSGLPAFPSPPRYGLPQPVTMLLSIRVLITRRTGASPRGICINSFPIVGLRCSTFNVVNLIPTAVFKIIESFRVFVQVDNHINLVHCN